jgi:hypothetical protein
MKRQPFGGALSRALLKMLCPPELGGAAGTRPHNILGLYLSDDDLGYLDPRRDPGRPRAGSVVDEVAARRRHHAAPAASGERAARPATGGTVRAFAPRSRPLVTGARPAAGPRHAGAARGRPGA